MRYRIPRSSYLAVHAARTSVHADAPSDAATTAHLLNVIDALAGMVAERAGHIGRVNDAIVEFIAEELLPGAVEDRLVGLLEAGRTLGVDDTGFGV